MRALRKYLMQHMQCKDLALRAMRVLRKIIRKHFACVALLDFRNARNARSAGTLRKI